MDMYQKRKMRAEKNNQEEKLTKVGINWYPGHMLKAKKQIIEDIKLIDVVIELLDSRIPLSSRNPDIYELTKNKKRIVILNKCDLADVNIMRKWVNYFEKETVTLCVDSNSGKGIEKVIPNIQKLMKDEVEKQKQRGMINKTIRILVLGIPNVGKSSFINRISKKTSMEVGNKPGVTKSKQWIRLKENIELLDTPGILWPKFENEKVALNLAFTGSIKDDVIELIEISYNLLNFLYENYKENIIKRYSITENELNEIKNQENYIYALMQIIGRKRGTLIKGGEIDDEKVARIIIDDFRSGKLGNICLEEPDGIN